MVWLDSRFIRRRSLLHPSDSHGRADVRRAEDDSDDGYRSVAAENDDADAGALWRNVYRVSDFERPGALHPHQQRGRDRTAGAPEPYFSAEGACRKGKEENGKIVTPRGVWRKVRDGVCESRTGWQT